MDVDVEFEDYDNNAYVYAESESESQSQSGRTIISSNSGTPAPSVYSYNSSRDGHNMLRELGGRTLNAQNDLYLLPADEGEHSRLDKQHLVHLLSVGRLYIAVEEVEAVLAPSPTEQKAILDLGCGGGIWATSMAQEFPHAQVVGIDLAPTTSRPPPPNCRFEFDDFTLGLEHYYGLFDVVHSRAVANGVRDFVWLIDEAARCLKPGGILIFIEGNLELMNGDGQAQEVAFGEGGPGQSWMARMCFEAYNTMKARGSQVDAAIMLERRMHACTYLEDVKYDVKWIPIGPWQTGSSTEDTQMKEMLGTLMRQNLKEFARSLVPLFLANGFPPELVERFVQGAHTELDELELHMYLQYHHCWARRRIVPSDGAAGEVAFVPTTADTEISDSAMEYDHEHSVSPPPSSTFPLSTSLQAESELTRHIQARARSPPSLHPGPRAVPVLWKADPETGKIVLDTESLAGSARSMGTANMSMSTSSG
ncbi:hypothetical protein M0805_000067 [Coniferiporia weirii]|nr:hypothetical protein M0805_000067 [Coniferiporia weirii]